MDLGNLFLDCYNQLLSYAKELHWDQITVAGVVGWGLPKLLKYFCKTCFNKLQIRLELCRKRKRLRSLNQKTENKYDNCIITFDTALPASLPENA